jgi:acetyl esterase/lipase
MKGANRGTRKRLIAAAALSWAALGLLWSQLILLPNPVLPPPMFAELLGDVPPSTHPQRFVAMIFKETSLLLCAFALVGLPLATLARRAGARWSALVATVLCAATAAISLVPVAQAWRTASAEGVTLSLSAYFAGLNSVAEGPSETATYARPDGEELKLDVWEPPGEDGGNAVREHGGSETQARPAVIVVHGGGWHAGSRSEFPRWDAWLADKGYVVFDIDYRLSPPARWQDAPEDVRCAIGWVKEHSSRYDVDPERVVLMGRSAGGQLALLTAYTKGASTLSPGCEVGEGRDTGVAAVVGFYPPTNLARLSSLG